MNAAGAYKRQSLFGGWTRVEMLLQIYDSAILSLEACDACVAAGDEAGHIKHFVKAQKSILAIHTGLKPDEDEVAFNIARLLHFVLVSIEKRDYSSAIKILSNLREGFAAIADEVDELEQNGDIPPIPDDDVLRSMV